jgi:Mn-dependent DtxR family transcriptional regulator/uncharacterized metal-binding protein
MAAEQRPANIDWSPTMCAEAPDSTKQRARARVYACSGATAPARLAQEIAARLRRLEVTAAARAQAIAIDGCPSACASRTLEAKGIHPAAIGLHELGWRPGDHADERARDALLARVVERLQALAQASAPKPAPRRRPAPPPAAGRDGRRAHTTDDYLYALHALTSPVVACGAVATDSPTLSAHVARLLSVSRPSAGQMLARLERAGQIERGPAREILLSPEGRAAAERVVRQSRVVERFLTDFLDYSAAESHDLALQIREAFDGTLVDRIASMLEPGARCPHGWPIDPAAERDQAAELVALSALPRGTRSAITALTEHDAGLLLRLYELGLEPGAEIEVLAESPDGRVVSVDGERRSLTAGEAAAVFVRARG